MGENLDNLRCLRMQVNKDMDILCSTCSSARVWLKRGSTGRDDHHGVSSFSKREEVRVHLQRSEV